MGMEPNHELPPVQEGGTQNLPSQQHVETHQSRPEIAGNIQQQQMPAQTATHSTQPVINSNTVSHASVQTAPVTGSDSTMIADDADLIEKEWVTKAKQIIEQTQTDPRLQSNELSKVKAEYVKKRYNKDIKTSEGP